MRRRKNNRIKRIRRLLGSCILCAVLLANVTGCGRDFDASGYSQALLDLTFQADITKAAAFMEDASEEALMQADRKSVV